MEQYFEHNFSFSQDDVILFSKATGDNNPIHLDEQYASRTSFKKPILHGILSASVFSKIFGSLYPGEGTIYLSQTMVFLKPMYVDAVYTAKLNLIEIDTVKGKAKYSTDIFDSVAVLTFKGEAVILHKIFKKDERI